MGENYINSVDHCHSFIKTFSYVFIFLILAFYGPLDLWKNDSLYSDWSFRR